MGFRRTVISSNGFSLFQQLFCLTFFAGSPLAIAEAARAAGPGEPEVQTIQLSDTEILRAFSDVRDDAEVQDAASTRAVNYWYADGRFISLWNNGIDSGEVTGTWRVENNLRCITISAGLPERIGEESCNPVFRRGDKYVSFNSDGSIHGIHTLSPLLQSSE